MRTWFDSVDARAKLLGVFVFVIASALLTDQRLILAALGIAISLAAVSRIRPRTLMRSYALALPFVLAASISMLFASGVSNSIAMFLRTSACIIPLLLLANGTDSFDLFRGLRRLRVPALVTSLLMLTHRFILLFSDELGRMKTARRARGFGGARSLLDRYGMSVLANTAGMVLVRADERANRVYEGMKAKGFRGDAIPEGTSRIRTLDIAFAICLTAAGAFLAISQLGGAVP